MQKWFFILVCQVDTMLLDTYYITGAWHMYIPGLFSTYYILYYSAPIILCIDWHMTISESLDTYYVLSCSARTMTRHLHATWHQLLTWHMKRF